MNELSTHASLRRARGLRLAVASVCLAAATSAVAAETSTDELQEIIVTAQFRSENLQTTPIAITAVTAEMLESRSQTNVAQIANQAPNVTLKPAGTSNGPSLIGFIRGIGQTDFNFAKEPGVGLYVDGVYYSTLTGSALDLLDLERLEILRGPQGTLAGKNSIGGAIKMFSKKPEGKDDGYVELTYGEYDRTELRGAADLGLSDNVFLRLSGVSKHQDGYVDRIDYGCSHPGSGVPTYRTGPTCKLGTEGGIDYNAARAALRWLPTDNVDITLTADITNDTSEAPANVISSIAPVGPLNSGFDATGKAVSGLGIPVAIPYDSRFLPSSKYMNYSTYLDPRVSSTSATFDGGTKWGGVAIPAISTLDARGFSANIEWKISDTLALTSITAYRRYESYFGDDADGSPVAVQVLLQHLKHNQKSQELRLNGTAGPVDWTVGGFYFKQESSEDARVDLAYPGIDFIHGPDQTPATTKAAFAHANWHITEKADFSLGMRYSDEEKEYIFARHSPDGTVPAACTIPGPGFLNGQPWNCSLYGDDGQSATAKDSRQDYRAALNYAWTDTFMTYASYSTGYKGGGINPRPFYPQQILAFKPETLDAFELGAKSELFDRKVRLNASIFSNKYKDIQLTLSDCTALCGAAYSSPSAVIANAGDADVKGAELEIEARPVAGLQLDAAFSMLKFDYTHIDPATGLTPCNGGMACDLITPYTPKSKWSAGIQYEFPLASGASITPRLDASYQSTVFTTPENFDSSRIGSYSLLNARVTWRAPSNSWQTSLEATNLTNEYYFLTIFDQTHTGGGAAAAQPGMPRQISLSFKKFFGK
jgi:iron complex outermembrane recepter protein